MGWKHARTHKHINGVRLGAGTEGERRPTYEEMDGYLEGGEVEERIRGCRWSAFAVFNIVHWFRKRQNGEKDSEDERT